MHAVCEDYRAGATIDRQLDEADLAAGRRIACPTFVLWASDYLGSGTDPLDVWRAWCTNVTGAAVDIRAISWPRRTRRDTLAALLRSSFLSRCAPASSAPWPSAPMKPTGKALQVRKRRCRWRGPRLRWRSAAAARAGSRTS